MKKFLIIALLGVSVFSVTAANISSSPPMQEQTITFPVFMTEQQNDVVLTNVNVESVVSEEIQNNFNLSGVFEPTMRSGFVYHPLDYEIKSFRLDIYKNFEVPKHYSINSEIKCRTDIFPSVSVPICS